MNQQINSTKDLELIKEHEEKIKRYKEKDISNITVSNYKHLAYKVKNPFRGL